jgi:hypothetical protein
VPLVLPEHRGEQALQVPPGQQGNVDLLDRQEHLDLLDLLGHEVQRVVRVLQGSMEYQDPPVLRAPAPQVLLVQLVLRGSGSRGQPVPLGRQAPQARLALQVLLVLWVLLVPLALRVDP